MEGDGVGEEESNGGDAMWPVLLLTTVLRFAQANKVERKDAVQSLSSFHNLVLRPWVKDFALCINCP